MDVHVAQINIGTMVAPTDDPAVAEFMDNLERINAQADAAPGFVWRLQTDDGNATAIQIFPDPLTLVNMSVWESVTALKDYVYRTEHVDYFRRRSEWFEPGAKRVALWWVAAGTVPELDEAVRRVEFLETYGATPYAFGFAASPEPLLFEPTSPHHPETVELLSQLERELERATPGSETTIERPPDRDVTGDRGRMLRARHAGRLIGCGALRRIDDRAGEVTHVFVDPQARGRALGAAMLDQLELEAARLGMGEIRLAASPHVVAAVTLGERHGYSRCSPWGRYVDAPESERCFRKAL